MKPLTRSETAAFLTQHDNYCILTHRRPDGDTLGSAAALCLGLRKLGKTAWILENPEISHRFRWLHQGLTQPAADGAAHFVTVDVASPSLLPDCFRQLLGKIDLRIDHHGSATSFTEWELVDGGSASCAEVVYDVLSEMGVALDRDMAEGLYVGASTDTGCFRFANTTAHTFSLAAVCAAAGARIYALNQELFETNTLGRLKMQAWIVEHLQILKDGTMAIVAIPRSVEQEIGVTEDDMDNISSFPRTVAGVRIAATLRQTAEADVKLSVRGIPGYDATVLAARFGGGGHKGAAGATIRSSLEDAAAAVEQAMMAME